MNEEVNYYEKLDRIIKYLFDKIEMQATYDELRNEFVTNVFENTPDNELAFTNIIEEDFESAKKHLINLGLIDKIDSEIYKLTFLGRIKYTRKFVDEYKTEQSEKKMKEALSRIQLVLSKWQKIGIGAAIIFGIGGLIFGTIQTLNKKCSCNEINYYTHKPVKYCNNYQCVDVPTIGNTVKPLTDTIK